MPTVGTTSRPGYVYDQGTDTWIPIGVGPHSHDTDYVTKSTIDAKGDLLAGSANDTVSRLAIGNNGETLVADSSASTGLRYQGAYAAGKNGCINGGMDIWQRGTSFTATNGSTSSYGPDRWNIYCGRAGLTISRQTSGLTGFQYSMRVQRDSGNTATTDVVISQALETVESVKYAGQQVTLSFWAKAGANYSPTSSAFTAQIRTGTGTDQIIWNGYTGTSTIASSIVTLTTSWQRFSVTGSAASTTNELTLLFAATPTGTAGANDWFEVTGVQVEIGSVATAFTRAGGTLAGELAACQRYYFRQTATAAYSNLTGFGYEQGATSAQYSFFPPVTMRVKPSSVDFSAIKVSDYASSFAITAFALNGNNADGSYFLVDATIASGGTAGRPCVIQANNNSAAYIGFSAEL